MTDSATQAADPATFRAQFPVFDRLSYLNAGTEGPVPPVRRGGTPHGSTSRRCRAAAASRTSRG